MDNPADDIEAVIQKLVSAPPSIQHQTLERYFLRDASFTHPFCRTGSFDGSRALIDGIYRWYQIMSGGGVDLVVHGVALDRANMTMYVNMTQVFSIWFVPLFSARVSLVTVLGLHHDADEGKYYIKSQEDLYQTSEFAKFALPFGGLGFWLVWLWQIVSTIMCLLLSRLFYPVTWFEDQSRQQEIRKLALPAEGSYYRGGSASSRAQHAMEVTHKKMDAVDGLASEQRAFETLDSRDGNGGLVTAPSIEKR